MEAPTNLKDTEMKITLNNAEIVTILVNYMQDKFPGKYTCELKTYTYDPVVIFETIEETVEVLETSEGVISNAL